MSQWIKDIRTIIGCEPPQLFKVLANIANKEEDSDRGIFARKTQSKILECIEAVKPFLGEIRRNAQDFTLHDIQHCINVIDFMGQMLADVESLNPAEISFFIYSALLHDIGMVKLPDEDISPNDLREDHGERSAKFIRERVLVSNDGTPFSFGEWDEVYRKYIPPICASHMQEFSFVEILPQSYFLDGMEVDMSLCAILLRLADAMDLKRNRAPYQLYQFIVNRSISEEHWKKHMSISNCQINEKGHFRVDGICNNEYVHRCLYNHLDMIESEISKVIKWKVGKHPKLRLSENIVERYIKTDNYDMWHHSFEMDVLKITNLFMGEQLYADKRFGLREIIQNSIDACMVRAEINKRLGNKQDYSYKPEIYIIFDRENNQVIIRDNGTGMNDYIIQNYFLNIGASYYSSNDFKKKNLEYSPSGYFGIGFLSAFMLSDDVYVRTAYWQEDVEYEFHFIKSDRFVTKTERPKTTFSGTEIRLNLDQFSDIFNCYDFREVNDVKCDRIIEFLSKNFWNLNTDKINDDAILCSIRKDSFVDFARKRIKNKYDYCIDLGEYLIDIEGIICLNIDKFFDSMNDIIDISEPNLLDTIKKGEIIISNNIKDIFTFVNHYYTFSENRDDLFEIKEVKRYYNSFIFFPTEESNVKINKNKTEITEGRIKEYLRLYNWNCLCFSAGVDFLRNRNNKDKRLDNDIYIKEQLSKHLKYLPSCIIRLQYFFPDTLYAMTKSKNIKNTYSYWLKQAKISLQDEVDNITRFFFFDIERIMMMISNSIIKPDTARLFIISSSGNDLVKAISICIYLWIYDYIKTDIRAISSAEYLKQLILKDWDSIKELLKPENKPV